MSWNVALEMLFWAVVWTGLFSLVSRLWRARKKKIEEDDAAREETIRRHIERNQAIEQMCVRHRNHLNLQEEIRVATEKAKEESAAARKRCDAMMDDANAPAFRRMTDRQLYFAALALLLSGEKSNALITELTNRSKR